MIYKSTFYLRKGQTEKFFKYLSEMFPTAKSYIKIPLEITDEIRKYIYNFYKPEKIYAKNLR